MMVSLLAMNPIEVDWPVTMTSPSHSRLPWLFRAPSWTTRMPAPLMPRCTVRPAAPERTSPRKKTSFGSCREPRFTVVFTPQPLVSPGALVRPDALPATTIGHPAVLRSTVVAGLLATWFTKSSKRAGVSELSAATVSSRVAARPAGRARVVATVEVDAVAADHAVGMPPRDVDGAGKRRQRHALDHHLDRLRRAVEGAGRSHDDGLVGIRGRRGVHRGVGGAAQPRERRVRHAVVVADGDAERAAVGRDPDRDVREPGERHPRLAGGGAGEQATPALAAVGRAHEHVETALDARFREMARARSVGDLRPGAVVMFSARAR